MRLARTELIAYSRRASAVLFFFLVSLGAARVSPTFAQELTASRIEHADREPQNWLTFYGNYRAWSYSPLDQITRENVKQLVPVWMFPTGGSGGLEAAPIVVDGVLYIENHQNNVFAMDAATGRPLWNYRYKFDHGDAYVQPRGARGLAAGYAMIFMGTHDNHMVALDAKSGKEVWNVEIEDPIKCCGITGAPIVIKDKVITGIVSGELAHRGYLSAFDVKTGKMVWRFYAIPAPGEPGNETWSGDSWRLGGGSTWFTGSYDPELNLIYWGIGNPSSDFYGEDRKGSNLYTDCLVAIDADTGKLKWYFQETPHDLYDFDANAEPVLIDVNQNGVTEKLVLHSGKNGYSYLLNRETGRFIRAFPFAQTVNWSLSLDKNGKPIDPVIPGEANKDFLFCPGSLGARNFNHSAYSPRTGLWYTSDFEICSKIQPQRMDVKEGDRWFAGTHTDRINPNGTPNISAFNPLTGEKQWTFKTTYVNASSLLATAGDLIFAGDVEGYAFALDAKTGQKIWSFNTGGKIASAPVSFSVNGRQYIAIGSGGGSIAESRVPQLYPRDKVNLPQDASTLFVFALPENTK